MTRTLKGSGLRPWKTVSASPTMPGRTSESGRMRGAGPRGTVARTPDGAVEGGAPGPAGAGRFGPTGGGAWGAAIAAARLAARTTPGRTDRAPMATRVVATPTASRWVIREPTGEPLENPDKGAVRVTRSRRGGLSRD